MKDARLYWKDQMRLGGLLLGKPVSEVPALLSKANEKRQKQINDALLALKSRPAVLSNVSGTWRFGSVSTGGFIRGDLTAHIHFGDDGDWTFNGTCWSGPQAIAGGGGGMWSTVPASNQKMDFHFGAASWVGGEIQVYWSIRGTVVGQLIAAVGGAAVSGGTGSGKWTRD